ncbi:MAG: glycosyltransferase family 39 protein [Chloroflexi bacterium]|nr:glycosyltransferase family 39 protein [Chloroflexota bacterium]
MVAASQPLERAVARPRVRWIVREHVFSALLVLTLACLLRLPFPDLTPFGHDEALEAERARLIWYGARPVDSEITSWWIPDPAGLLYVYSLAEALPHPARARVLLVASLNVVSVMLCYALARRFYGPRVGLIAGFLYAVNPWAVTFGRQPWVITQPLLTVLMLFSAAMVVERRDRRWVIPFFLAGAAQTQTHLLAVLYGPPVALTLLLFIRRWLVPQLALGVVGAVTLVAPFAHHIWTIWPSIADALERGNRGLTVAPDSSAVTLTAWLLSGQNLEAKLGFPDPAMAMLRGPLALVTVVTVGLLLIGMVVAARACWRRTSGWEADALLLIWLGAPLALMTWQSSAVYIHYVLCLVPVPFLMIARGAGALWQALEAPAMRDRTTQSLRRLWGDPDPPQRTSTERAPTAHQDGRPLPTCWPAGRPVVPFVTPAVLMVVVLVQVAAVGAFYAALDRSLALPPSERSPTDVQQALNAEDLKARQMGIGEIHGLPLQYWQSVADQTRLAARNAGARNVVVVTGIQDAANRQLDKRRKALAYLLGPDLEPRFPLQGLTVLPTRNDALALTIPEQNLPRTIPLGPARLLDVPLPGTNGSTRGWLIRARPAHELVSPRWRTDAAFVNGARLLGLDGPTDAQPGQSIPLEAYWVVEHTPAPGDDDEPYVALVDTTGRTVAVVSRGGLPSGEWRSGDLLAQRMTLTVPVSVPDGTYHLQAGLRSASSGQTVALENGDRTPDTIAAGGLVGVLAGSIYVRAGAAEEAPSEPSRPVRGRRRQ